MKYVGHYLQSTVNLSGQQMVSLNEHTILRDMKEKKGTAQVTCCFAIAFVLGWVIDKTIRKEYEENWKDVYMEVHELEIPNNENVIELQSPFSIKIEDKDFLCLKSRNVAHVNDVEKDIHKY